MKKYRENTLKHAARTQQARAESAHRAEEDRKRREAMGAADLAKEADARHERNVMAHIRGRRFLRPNFKMLALLDQPWVLTDRNNSIEKDEKILDSTKSHNNSVRRKRAKLEQAEALRAQGINRRASGFHVGGNRKLRAEDRALARSRT